MIKVIMIFLLILLLGLFFFVLLTLIKHQFSFDSVKFLFYGFIIVFAFLNYLRNLSSSRYFSLTFSNEEFNFAGIKKEFSFKSSDINRVIYLRQHDILGITNYMIIIRKGFSRNIFLSDFKSKDCDLKRISDNKQLGEKEVINITNSFLSQIILFFFMTLSI